MLRTIGTRAVWAALLLAVPPLAGSPAQPIGADLNISPKRIVLGEGQRSATVYVFNQGDTPATYRVTLVDRVMTPDGRISEAVDRPAASARDVIDYTPRVITLQPKHSQAVRLRVKRPPGHGEYRTHLTVTPQPPEDVGLTAAEAAEAGSSEALAVRVVALFSLSIPVIVRSGEVGATAAIEKASIVPTAEAKAPPALAFDIVRHGSGSLYGDVDVYVGEGRKEQRIARVRGVAVYPEIERRSFVAGLTQPVRRGQHVRVVYRDDDVRPGTELATVSLVVP